jgi:hypothetical protein
MQNYTMKFSAPTTTVNEDGEDLFEGVTEDPRPGFNRDVLHGWAAEARHLVWLVLDAPSEVLGLVGNETPRDLRRKIRQHLRDLGYTHQRVAAAFAMVRASLAI